MPEFVHGHGVVFPDCDYEPGVDPMRAAGARDRRARPRGGRDGPGGGALPRLGQGAAGRAADEEMGQAARAAGARAALLACSRSARRSGGRRKGAAAKLGEKWDALVVDEAQEGREDDLPEHDGDRRVPGPADGRAGGGAAARVAVGGPGRGATGRPLEGRGRGTREGGRAARSSS